MITKKKLRSALGMEDGDQIIAAWPTHEGGPGWQNRPFWVVVGHYDSCRVRCFQPEEWWQIESLNTLANIAEDVHAKTVTAIAKATGAK